MVLTTANDSGVLTAGEAREEGADITFLIWLTARATSDLVDSTLAPHGLTGDEFAIYSMLASSTTTTPSTLARWMAAPATTVSSYVKRFEGRGHVRREANPRDGRSYLIQLTEAGYEAHQQARATFAPVREALVSAVGVDADEVKETLLMLREALDRVRTASSAVSPAWEAADAQDEPGSS